MQFMLCMMLVPMVKAFDKELQSAHRSIVYLPETLYWKDTKTHQIMDGYDYIHMTSLMVQSIVMSKTMEYGADGMRINNDIWHLIFISFIVFWKLDMVEMVEITVQEC